VTALVYVKKLLRARRFLAELSRTTLFIGCGGAAGLVIGSFSGSALAIGVGAAGLTFAATRAGMEHNLRELATAATRVDRQQPSSAPAVAEGVKPTDIEALVRQMLGKGRYALLLRPEVVPNLNQRQFQKASDALDDAMAMVPAGEVVIGRWGDQDETAANAGFGSPGTVVRVENFYLDRFLVTNRQYQEFVTAGGYEEMAIWDPEIWPGVLDFVDQTGYPGPRDWNRGRFESGKDDHPVVGVSWYEAAAYARWVGKRLPTGAEWEKAGSWPVNLSVGSRPQRRFPWGDSMDRRRANLWGSGPGATDSVYAFGEGISVGDVHQLIGNVWEWTTTTFGNWSYPARDVVLSTPMKTIRGGAFDTYFDNQATCQFQSGEDPVARKHNLGFRCALSVCDLAPAPGDAETPETAEPHEPPRAADEPVAAVVAADEEGACV